MADALKIHDQRTVPDVTSALRLVQKKVQRHGVDILRNENVTCRLAQKGAFFVISGEKGVTRTVTIVSLHNRRVEERGWQNICG